MQDTYAQALKNVLASGTKPEVAVDNLVQHLKATGRMKLLPGILRSLKRLEARSKTVSATVEVAHQKDAHQALAEAKELGIDAAHAHVNHSLLAGWRARSGSVLVDRSAKRALIDLYRTITSH